MKQTKDREDKKRMDELRKITQKLPTLQVMMAANDSMLIEYPEDESLQEEESNLIKLLGEIESLIKDVEKEKDNVIKVELEPEEFEHFKGLQELLCYKSMSELLKGAVRILDQDILNSFQERMKMPESDEEY